MEKNNQELEKIIEEIGITEKINIEKSKSGYIGFIKEYDDALTFEISGSDVKTVFNNKLLLDLIKTKVIDVIGNDWLKSMQNVKSKITISISLDKKTIQLFFVDFSSCSCGIGGYNPTDYPKTSEEFHDDFCIIIKVMKFHNKSCTPENN